MRYVWGSFCALCTALLVSSSLAHTPSATEFLFSDDAQPQDELRAGPSEGLRITIVNTNDRAAEVTIEALGSTLVLRDSIPAGQAQTIRLTKPERPGRLGAAINYRLTADLPVRAYDPQRELLNLRRAFAAVLSVHAVDPEIVRDYTTVLEAAPATGIDAANFLQRLRDDLLAERGSGHPLVPRRAERSATRPTASREAAPETVLDGVRRIVVDYVALVEEGGLR